MLFISDLTYEKCLEELSTNISEKFLRGYVRNTKQGNEKYPRARFSVTKRSLKIAGLRLPIQIYVFGEIAKTEKETNVKMGVRYGFSSLVEFLAFTLIVYAILTYSTLSYKGIPQGLVIIVTIVIMGFLTTISYSMPFR